MSNGNVVFLEVLEWFDDTGNRLVHRIPEKGSGEIKFGAQLIVRDSQAGVFFYKGKALEAFGPGRHTLKTANIPLLTKMAAIPWAMTSPLRAEMYFVNMKVFTNLKWGTRDPVAFKDSELGLVRLRAFGVFNLQVVQPVLFVNKMVGTQGIFETEAVEEYLNRVIVSRFNDYMGETLDTILNLPSKYEQLSQGLAGRVQDDFGHFGLAMTHLYVNSITPPPEVQQAIDDRSRMGVFNDMNRLMQMKAAMAMEKAAGSEGGAGDGMGMGMGIMMPAMFAQYFTGASSRGGDGPPSHGGGGGAVQVPESGAGKEGAACQDCESRIPLNSRFCPYCGHQQLVFAQCESCGKNLTPNARFCSRCGKAVEEKPGAKSCSACGCENLHASKFCNDCGEKL